MQNFDLKKYLTEGKLVTELPKNVKFKTVEDFILHVEKKYNVKLIKQIKNYYITKLDDTQIGLFKYLVKECFFYVRYSPGLDFGEVGIRFKFIRDNKFTGKTFEEYDDVLN